MPTCNQNTHFKHISKYNQQLLTIEFGQILSTTCMSIIVKKRRPILNNSSKNS